MYAALNIHEHNQLCGSHYINANPAIIEVPTNVAGSMKNALAAGDAIETSLGVSIARAAAKRRALYFYCIINMLCGGEYFIIVICLLVARSIT